MVRLHISVMKCSPFVWLNCKHPVNSEEIQDENEIFMYAQIDRDVTTCGVSRYHA